MPTSSERRSEHWGNADHRCLYPPRKTAKLHNDDCDQAGDRGHLFKDDEDFTKARTAARELLSQIHVSFRLPIEPHPWRSKVRWVTKDNQALTEFNLRLRAAERVQYKV
ncbi:hypothetical protein F4778DRAFT_737258 [Xylariomycetidae sp. FL2044]|nr:hypothetical protein F4778DRAFT_737258 [Xylariomycetidae sp. FL2044]